MNLSMIPRGVWPSAAVESAEMAFNVQASNRSEAVKDHDPLHVGAD